MALTDTACKNAKCPDGKARERYTDSGGLYLEVQPSGAKHWRWKYRFAGKEKRLALGTYPAVTLAQARRARDEARDLLKAGTDPVQEKKDAKLARRLALGTTFEAVSRQWFEHWKGPKSPRHADYVLRRLEADVFPVLGAKPIGEITAPPASGHGQAHRGPRRPGHRQAQPADLRPGLPLCGGPRCDRAQPGG
ncbi:tyrosine-type recombinase/integrase [Caldimonas taiwanensis]|uniref:tyrosine-type recombinase/integrase n=1 Tax=Caldimonas taiwanensis TaxID=307483 RepID=UPI003529EC7C